MPQGEVVVRRAAHDDFARVGQLTFAAYLTDGFVETGNPYGAQLQDTAARAADAEVWVAEIEDPSGSSSLVVGSVTWCPVGSSWREVARDDEGEFRMLAVDPSGRRRGVARRLVERCIELAREADLAGVALSSMPTQTSAHQLYLSLGFHRDPADDWTPVPGVDLWGFRLRF